MNGPGAAPLREGSGLTLKQFIRVDTPAIDKHSSLVDPYVGSEEKEFCEYGPDDLTNWL